MANSLPFNSMNRDRVCKAEDWAWYFSTFIGNGVFPNPSTGLQVVANAGMKVTVKEGYAFINGYAFRNKPETDLTLDTADGALARIDRVVVRWDLTERNIYIKVLKGTISANPVAQAITRSTEVYDIVLADIYVGKGVTEITTENITDTRLNSEICGIVTQTVETVDTTTLYNQIQASYDNFKLNMEAYFNGYKLGKETEFESWFQNIKNQLSTDAAGNLQNQIDELYEKMAINVIQEELDADSYSYKTSETLIEKEIFDGKITLNSIVYGGDKFVAVGDTDGAQVIYSYTGREWSLGNLSSDVELKKVAYGNGKFVAAGKRRDATAYEVWCSSDGIDWEECEIPQKTYAKPYGHSVAYGNGKFVISDLKCIYISTDGKNWTEKAHEESRETVRFTGNKFYIGQYSSTDAITWIKNGIYSKFTNINGVAYGKGKYIATGHFTGKAKIYSSVDGINWTEEEKNITGQIFKLYYRNGIFIAEGRQDIADENFFIMISKDGANWYSVREINYTDAEIAFNEKTMIMAHSGGIRIIFFKTETETVETAINELHNEIREIEGKMENLSKLINVMVTAHPDIFKTGLLPGEDYEITE